MAPTKRGDAARSAVLKYCPTCVDDGISEYLADTAVSLFEDAEDGSDHASVRQELLDAISPFLEDAGVTAGEAAIFCGLIVDATLSHDAATTLASLGKGGGYLTAVAAATIGGTAPGASTSSRDAEEDYICRVPNLLLMYGGSPEPLLKNTTLELIRGHRYGIVGANGTGKTTLMSKVAATEIEGLPKTLRCVHLQHEAIMRGIQPSTLARDYARLRCGEASEVSDAELALALTGVGFEGEMLEKAVSELSGGWQMRLALACALAQKAEVLLLDEPTNHLDVEAVQWLVDFIRTTCVCGGAAGGTAMVVSHDPAFLNQVCTDIIHFTSDGKLVYHPGDFDAFKVRELHGDEIEARRLLEVVPREGDFCILSPAVDSNRMSFPMPDKITDVSSNKPVVTLQKVSHQYKEGEVVLRGVSLELTLKSRVAIVGKNGTGKSTLMAILAGQLQPTRVEGSATAGEVWRHMSLRLSYISQQHMVHLGDFKECTPVKYVQLRFQHGYDKESQERLSNIELTAKERLAIKKMAAKHGKRGKEVEAVLSRRLDGKTFLYEVKWKDLNEPHHNTFEPLTKLEQLGVHHQVALLDDMLAYTWGGTAERPLTDREIVKHLEGFGLLNDAAMNRQISMLSSGQKARLMLGASFWTKPHCVCFDEPTNYLDVEAVEGLHSALKHFRGGFAIVTHSERFLEDLCRERWEMSGGHVAVSRSGANAKAT